jgi:hypothetical protein
MLAQPKAEPGFCQRNKKLHTPKATLKDIALVKK